MKKRVVFDGNSRISRAKRSFHRHFLSFLWPKSSVWTSGDISTACQEQIRSEEQLKTGDFRCSVLKGHSVLQNRAFICSSHTGFTLASQKAIAERSVPAWKQALFQVTCSISAGFRCDPFKCNKNSNKNKLCNKNNMKKTTSEDLKT